MKKKIEIAESNLDGCCGFKYPNECPHDGKFILKNKACEEREQDMIDAMSMSVSDWE